MISLIVAMTTNQVIGYQGQMPWHLPADLAHFKKTTLGKPVLMGRKTYESLYVKPLPERRNIILTRNPNFTAPNCLIASTLDQALSLCSSEEESIVIGGADIFKQTLPLAKRLYITWIHAEIKGDTFFPEWNKKEWIETSRQDFIANEKNPYAYSFCCLERA